MAGPDCSLGGARACWGVGVRQVAFGDVLVTRMNAERQGETTIPNRGFTPTDSAYHPKKKTKTFLRVDTEA